MAGSHLHDRFRRRSVLLGQQQHVPDGGNRPGGAQPRVFLAHGAAAAGGFRRQPDRRLVARTASRRPGAEPGGGGSLPGRPATGGAALPASAAGYAPRRRGGAQNPRSRHLGSRPEASKLVPSHSLRHHPAAGGRRHDAPQRRGRTARFFQRLSRYRSRRRDLPDRPHRRRGAADRGRGSAGHPTGLAPARPPPDHHDLHGRDGAVPATPGPDPDAAGSGDRLHRRDGALLDGGLLAVGLPHGTGRCSPVGSDGRSGRHRPGRRRGHYSLLFAGGYIITGAGFSAYFLTVAAVALVGALCLWLLVPKDPAPENKPREQPRKEID